MNAGRRAIARWALRMFRREWRQQLAVLILLTITVGAAVAGSTIAVNAASTSGNRLGNATTLLRIDGSDPAAATTALAQIHQDYDPVQVITHASITPPGLTTRLDVRDQSPTGPLGAPLLHLRSGAFPTSADEAALTTGAAEQLGAHTGSTLDLGGRTVMMVGTVENPRDLGDQFVLVQPGSIEASAFYAVLTNSAEARLPADLPALMEAEQSNKAVEHRAIEAAVVLVSTLALVLAGLSAAAGFVVVANRRQRQLGLLAAIGATQRHIRLVMIVNGAIVGFVAAVVGTAAGVLGWILAAPAVEAAARHRISRFDLPWGLIAVLAGLATFMATLAAWWPARSATKLPVMAALSGRPSPPSAIHRSLVVAVLFLTGGVLAVANSHPGTEQVSIPKVIGGMLALAAGIILMTPTAIRGVGAVARRLPIAPRLALRDLARYQSRAAAALAAIVLSLSIAVSIVLIASANAPRATDGNLSSNELLIQVGSAKNFPTKDMTAAQIADLDARAATVVAALGAGEQLTPLDVAFGSSREPVAIAIKKGPHTLDFDGFPFVATPGVLALCGIDAATIDARADVLGSRAQDVLLVDGGGNIPRLDAQSVPLQQAALPRWSAAPHSLITESAVQRRGLRTARVAWIVESRHPISARQAKTARVAAAAVGLAIEARKVDDSVASLRNGAVGVGALLALSILTMAVGLIRGEARRDTRTLVATGAAARTRRAITASTAAGLALPGVLLSIAGAYAGVIAVYHSKLHILTPVPYRHLLVLAVGLPLIAAAGGWLLAGRQPSTISRHALD